MDTVVRRKIIKSDLDSPYRIPKYSILEEGGEYVVVDCYGSTKFRKNTAREALISALGALTSGRTWKETVYILGNVELYDIDIPSYTRLVIDGKVSIPSSSEYLFKIEGTDTEHKKNVEIVGGEFYGGYTTVDQKAIYIKCAENIDIHDTYIQDFQVAIMIDGVGSSDDNKNIEIHDNFFMNNGNAVWSKYFNKMSIEGNVGVAPTTDPYHYGFHCDVFNNVNISGNIYEGADIIIHLATGSYIDVTGNLLRGGRGGGITFIGDCWHGSCTSNTIVNMAKEGIECRAGLHYGVISANTMFNCGYAGLRLFTMRHHLITDNTIIDCGHVYNDAENPYLAQITILCDSDTDFDSHSVLKNNKCINRSRTPDYQIYLGQFPGRTGHINYIDILDNFLDTANVEVIHKEGSNIRIKRNKGYTTENSGTATFSGDGSTTTFQIPHGLVSTPNYWSVTPASADACGDFYVTADGTNLTVTYTSPPPAGTDNIVLKWSAEV